MPPTDQRNLLFGVVAVQHAFITADQLVEALQHTATGETALGDVLERIGSLKPGSRQQIDLLVETHLRARACGDVSLSTIPALARADDNGSSRAVNGDESLATLPVPPAEHMPQQRPEALEPRRAPSPTRRFQFLRPHAQGGLGKVSVAKDEELNREVALKEIQPQYADDESARARFVLEAEVTGGLEHPGIVPVYGLGRDLDGRPYYAMRFIRGESFKEVADRFHDASSEFAAHDRTVQLRRLLQRFIDVCQAIEYAHSRGVIHRDIKPGNIMLGDYGETLVVDWGLAKARGTSESSESSEVAPTDPTQRLLAPASGSSVEPTQMGSTVGTLQFMSPEQSAGRVDLMGPASDIYSLGATLYYILTGQPSVTGKTVGEVLDAVRSGRISPPSSVARGIAKPLEAICLKAMALDPQDRYASAQALASDLERWLADEPVDVHTETLADRAARWLRRNRAWFRAALTGIAVVIVVLCVAVFLIDRERDQVDQQRQRAETLAREKTELALLETDLRKKAQREAVSRSFEQSLLRARQADPTAGVLSLVNNLAEAQSIQADDLETSIRAQLGRWEGSLHTLGAVTLHGGAIGALVQSPDGKSMLVATSGPTTLVDLASGEAIGKPLAHGAPVSAAAFFRDGEVIVTASEDRTVRFWDAKTTASIGEPLKHDEPVVAIALSPEDRYLAAIGGNQLRLWFAESRQPSPLTFEHTAALTGVAFSPTEPVLFTSDWDGRVHLWNTETGERAGPAWEHDSPVLGVAIAPDGKLAAISELGSVARIRETASGDIVGAPLSHQGMVSDIQFDADGKRLVTASADQSARIWDVKTGAMIGPPLRHPLMINAAVFDTERNLLWTGSGDGGLRRWHLANQRSTPLPLGANGNVVAASFTEDASSLRMLSSALDAGGFVIPGELRAWQVPSSAQSEVTRSSDRWSEVAAFSPDGRSLAIGQSGNTIEVISLGTDSAISPPIPLAAMPTAVAFSHDNSLLLVGTEAGEVSVWQIPDGTKIGEPLQLEERISSVAFFPGDQQAIVGSWDQAAYVLDLTPSARPPVKQAHDNLVISVGVHPEATMYVTSTADGSLRLWNAASHQQIGSVMKHASRAKLVRFAHDGSSLFAGYGDGSTRQWDVGTLSEVGEPLWHSKEVMALALSRDGTWAATASTDWTARLWKVAPAQGEFESVRRRFEVLTGMRMAEDGSLQILTIDQWQQRERQLKR